jgi:hypothetical protein
MTVDGEVSISNGGDETSCWKTCDGGKFDAGENKITTLTCHGCARSAVGFVRRKKLTKTVDVDYTYAKEVLELTWQVTGIADNGRWPTWTKSITSFEAVLQT